MLWTKVRFPFNSYFIAVFLWYREEMASPGVRSEGGPDMHLITVEALQQACHHTSQSRGHGLSACQPPIWIPHPVCLTTWTLAVEIMQIAFPWQCLSLSKGGGSLHVCAVLFVFRIQGRVSARANANDIFKVQIITWAHRHTMKGR